MNKKTIPLLIFTLFFVSVGFGSFSAAGIMDFRSSLDTKNLDLSNKNFRNHVEGEVLVKFKGSAGYSTRLNALSAKGGQRLKEFGRSGYMQVKLGDGQSVQQAINEYSRDRNIEWVQPNYIYTIQNGPNDPMYGEQWGLSNSGANHMNVEAAWGEITDCSSILVAVVDSGINYNHEDLAGNMWDGGSSYSNHGYNFVENNYDPMDKNGHGTHVAGTIGAVGNNNKGISGVCRNVQIMAVKVMNASGFGTTADIVEGLSFAVDKGAHVVNMSLGGPEFDQAFYNALGDARDAGVLVISAAGNESNNVDVDESSYPCAYDHDNIVCVAALDQDYNLAGFSNYGSSSVHVGAPGTDILSTWSGETIVYATENSTEWHLKTTRGSNWGGGISDDFGMLMFVPSPWGNGSTYEADTLSAVYKVFPDAITEADVAVLEYYVDVIHIYNFDRVRVNIGDRTDPYFSLDSAVAIYENQYWQYDGLYIEDLWESIDITSQVKNKNKCVLSFWLNDYKETAQGFGAFIVEPTITTLTYNIHTYHVLEGTSMAAPHVAGLAAMLMAFNPDYTYEEVVASIIKGGVDTPSLDGKTTTGKAADAWGSLKHIESPAGVSAQLIE